MEIEKPQDTCAAKIEQGSISFECGQPLVYLTAEQAQEAGRGQYSGWRHVDAEIRDHSGVPKSWVS